jgi:acetyl esterase/lipase
MLPSLSTMTPASAVKPTVLLLWPAGARGNRDADKPSITVFLPAQGKANGTAVLICPGGAYGMLVTTFEGNDVARWLNQYGIAGIVLKYRISPYRHPAPWLDARRAMRIVRANAANWHLNPQRIGIMGFSAGGHLASTLGTHFDEGNRAAADPIERQSCRPDFMALIYPVITMGAKTHPGSRTNLLGNHPSEAEIALLSNETQVTPQTPPTFLAHAVHDHIVSVDNSVMFYAALQAHQVPAEFLELPTGDHCLGFGHSKEWDEWQQACLHWFVARHLLQQTALQPGNQLR